MRDTKRAERSHARSGFDALRRAVAAVLLAPSPTPLPAGPPRLAIGPGWLLNSAAQQPAAGGEGHAVGEPRSDDSAYAASSAEDADERTRLIALVELARAGDAEAFGQLYDHYQGPVYRFLYYRVGSTTLAEDLTSETFFRALRSMSTFRWQGKDFGAWLMTIARNLTTDHFKSGRNRLEHSTDDLQTLDGSTPGPEGEVLSRLTNEALLDAMGKLPNEQRECLVLRFLQGFSIIETADALGRSGGAVKQLQLRGVRNLAKLLPEQARP